MTGCLIHGVTKCSGIQNACVRFSFPVLPFRKIKFIIKIGLSYEFSVAGCSLRDDRAMDMSLFAMCMIANGN